MEQRQQRHSCRRGWCGGRYGGRCGGWCGGWYGGWYGGWCGRFYGGGRNSPSSSSSSSSSRSSRSRRSSSRWVRVTPDYLRQSRSQIRFFNAAIKTAAAQRDALPQLLHAHALHIAQLLRDCARHFQRVSHQRGVAMAAAVGPHHPGEGGPILCDVHLCHPALATSAAVLVPLVPIRPVRSC